MRQMLKAAVLGQLMSLFLTGTSFSSAVLIREGIVAPMAQSVLVSLLIAVVFGFLLLHRRQPLKLRWYLYSLLAVVNLEATYLAVKSLQYTSITSVMLLDCWSIPCALLLTWLFLKTRYNRGHLISVSVCVLGLVLVVVSDVHAGDRSGGSNAVLGDTLIFVASIMYGCCNVYEEFLAGQVDRVELLAVFGISGALIGSCQIIFLERHELAAIPWTAKAILPFAAYAGCSFAFGALLPYVLQIGGSTMINLSLLTTDMYAVGIQVVFFNQQVDWLYFAALGTVTTGIVCYSLSGEGSAPKGVYKLLETSNLDSTLDSGISTEFPRSPTHQLSSIVLGSGDPHSTSAQDPLP